MNIEKFRNDNKVFYESGIVREIFASDKYCICSVAEAAYVMFNYFSTKDGYGGLMLHPSLIKLFINDKNKFDLMISRIDDKSFNDNLFVLSPVKFEELKKIREQFLIKPSSSIDYELESQIMAKDKSR